MNKTIESEPAASTLDDELDQMKAEPDRSGELRAARFRKSRGKPGKKYARCMHPGCNKLHRVGRKQKPHKCGSASLVTMKPSRPKPPDRRDIGHVSAPLPPRAGAAMVCNEPAALTVKLGDVMKIGE